MVDTKCQIAAVQSAFPPHYFDQATLTQALKDNWGDNNLNERVVDRLHQSVSVKKRHLAIPIEDYVRHSTFAERNNVFIDVGLKLAEECVLKLLAKTKVDPQSISQIIFTTVTGIAVPSIDARLMNRIQFSTKMKRLPLFGLGCVAGAAGISRAADYLVGHPEHRVILLALELCSLTVQRNDNSVANMVASGLFGDGCAAVMLTGNNKANHDAPLPRVVDSRSFFFPESEEVMGWKVTNDGFKIVLNADVPKVAEEKLPACIDELLSEHGLQRTDVAAWIAHPGGPKVIQALEDGLKLHVDALNLSRESLEEVGNLSSASVLLILQKTLERRHFRPGEYGVLLAMGPAFCAEVVLLKW